MQFPKNKEYFQSKRLQYDRLPAVLPDSELNIPVPQSNPPNSSPQSAPAAANAAPNAKKRKIDNSTEANVNGKRLFKNFFLVF